jgi:hypothetical protein
MKGTIIHVLFLRVGKQPPMEGTVIFKSTKSSPGYEKYFPEFTIVEGEREITVGEGASASRAVSAVKSFRGETALVEIAAPFDCSQAGPALAKKNMLDAAARKIAIQHGPLDLLEEYTFFTVEELGDLEAFLARNKLMIAQLVRDETASLAEKEVEDAISSQLRYDQDDLAVLDWDGAVLLDKNGEFYDAIALIELANIQLLSLRALDGRLTAEVGRFREIQGLGASNILHQSRTLRSIINVRTSGLFDLESIDNAIRLYGDWYAAKAYALAERKLYLAKWRQTVEDKLAMLEKIFGMASHRQVELYNITLEFLIVLLILVEIVLIVMGKI